MSSQTRYVTMTVLNYLASEVHTNFNALFEKDINEERKKTVQETLGKKFDYIQKNLLEEGKKDYLVDNKFSIADMYFYVLLQCAEYVGIDLNKHPHIKALFERVQELPVVKEANARMAENPTHTF